MSSKSLRILVALDGTPGSETILASLMPLARAATVDLTLFKVAAGPDLVEEARVYLARLKGALALHRISAGVEVEIGEPGPRILARLRSGDFDFGAMSTHGRRGLDRVLMGSVAENVARSSETPLFVNRPDAKIGDWRKIVVALDGSPEAEEVLDDATFLARLTGSTLYLASVSEPLVASPGLEFAYGAVTLPDMKPYVDIVRARLASKGLKVETGVFLGPPAAMIAQFAVDIGAGLIAMTTHGRSGLGRFVMGSVAEQIMRTAPCPVLVRPIRNHAGAGPGAVMENSASR